MEYLTFHDMWESLRGRNDQRAAILAERLQRFHTWPVTRLLRIIYETRDYAERDAYLAMLCEERIQPILQRQHNHNNNISILIQMRRDLLEFLDFKRQYDNTPEQQPMAEVLQRYSMDMLQTEIAALEHAIERQHEARAMAFMQTTHARLGQRASFSGLSSDLWKMIADRTHS
jgi:hypothetical protein